MRIGIRPVYITEREGAHVGEPAKAWVNFSQLMIIIQSLDDPETVEWSSTSLKNLNECLI